MAVMFSTSQIIPLALAAVGLFLVQRLLSIQFRDKEKAEFWAKTDAVGVPSSGIFIWTRALLKSLTSTQKNTFDGYRRFSKAKGLPFQLPTLWNGGPVAVLPPSQLHLLNRPDSEVKAFDAQLETIQLPYMISDRDVYMNVIHFDVVRKHMISNKNVQALAVPTADEVDVAFRECWGSSTDWTTVNGWDACGRIVTRTATRILIGLPLCRDEVFFEQSRLFGDSVVMGTAMINCFPPLVRPLLGPLIALRAKYYEARCLKILVPFVEERIRRWKEGKEEEGAPDFLKWMIPKCAKEGPEQMDPVRMATRLLALNVMFVIGMAYVFAHCVLDIYGSPAKEEFVSGLEAECKKVLAETGSLSQKDAVDRLYKVDSAIRESMRTSDIAVTALSRDVVCAKIDLGNGIQIPRGVRVVFPTQPMHQDPDYHEDPLRFDAFRFSRKFEGQEEDDKRSSERESLTTITPSWLAYGYGKHQCPGRWFASQTMKQALAYLVMNYDVEIVQKPDKRQVLLNVMIPATEAQIRIRRKQ